MRPYIKSFLCALWAGLILALRLPLLILLSPGFLQKMPWPRAGVYSAQVFTRYGRRVTPKYDREVRGAWRAYIQARWAGLMILLSPRYESSGIVVLWCVYAPPVIHLGHDTP